MLLCAVSCHWAHMGGAIGGVWILDHTHTPYGVTCAMSSNKRPSSSQTEEELLKLQKEFLASKEKPSVTVVRNTIKQPQKQPLRNGKSVSNIKAESKRLF